MIKLKFLFQSQFGKVRFKKHKLSRIWRKSSWCYCCNTKTGLFKSYVQNEELEKNNFILSKLIIRKTCWKFIILPRYNIISGNLLVYSSGINFSCWSFSMMCLKKSFIKNFIFCAVLVYLSFNGNRKHKNVWQKIYRLLILISSLYKKHISNCSSSSSFCFLKRFCNNLFSAFY